MPQASVVTTNLRSLKMINNCVLKHIFLNFSCKFLESRNASVKMLPLKTYNVASLTRWSIIKPQARKKISQEGYLIFWILLTLPESPACSKTGSII